MSRVLVLPEEVQMILDRLDNIESLLERQQGLKEDTFMDSQEFLQLCHISKRLGQHWRDTGVIPFSQIGSKIYYKMSDVKAMIDKHMIGGKK